MFSQQKGQAHGWLPAEAGAGGAPCHELRAEPAAPSACAGADAGSGMRVPYVGSKELSVHVQN